MNFKTISVALLLSASVMPAQAQQPPAAAPQSALPSRPLTTADLDSLRAELQSGVKQTVASNLTLTDAEAARFWPVYDRYAAEVIKINDDKYKIIVEYANNYGKFDDKTAESFTKSWLDLDVKLAQLRVQYAPQFARAVPGVKAATFLQIERRISLILDLRIASLLPILQYQTAKTGG